jgi:hypothetical protein
MNDSKPTGQGRASQPGACRTVSSPTQTGGVLSIKVHSNLVGPLAIVAGSAWVVFLFGSSYGAASLAPSGSDWWGAYFFAWLGAWVGALLPIGVTLLLLVFPTGKPVGWWRLFMVRHSPGFSRTSSGPSFSGVSHSLLHQAQTDLDEVVEGWVEVIDATMSPSSVGHG